MEELRYIGDYRMLEKIAKGSQGSIWKVVKVTQPSTAQTPQTEESKPISENSNEKLHSIQSTNDQIPEKIILKRINHKSDNSRTLFTREKLLKNKLKHKYLVEIQDIIDNQTENAKVSYIVYKRYPTDLLEFLKHSPNSRVPEKTVKRWVRQITKAMVHLNDQGIMHRDLKPDNILLTSHSEDAKIKLCDFGLIREFDETNASNNTLTHVGTFQYAAPEVRKLKQYSFNCDVWSLGVITHVLIYGKFPKIKKNRIEFPATQDQPEFIVSKNAESFIEICLTTDPIKRPLFSGIINHAFLITGKKYGSSLKKQKICEDYEIERNFDNNLEAVAKKEENEECSKD